MPSSVEVVDGQITPVLLQVVHHQTAVAEMAHCLTAKQAAALDDGGIDVVLDFPLLHEVQEGQLVVWPVLPLLPEGGRNVGRRSQSREVDVGGVADFFEELPECRRASRGPRVGKRC